MLGQLFRRLVGDKPAEFGHRIASAVAAPALTPVAARVLDRYRNSPPPQGAEYYVDGRAFTEELLQTVDPADLLPATRTIALQVLGTVVAVLALVAAADCFFQYRQWFERQKMSVRDLKEEFRQTEGDPFIKAKIKRASCKTSEIEGPVALLGLSGRPC